MNFNVIIPARYASQRLPGKPLLDIAGKTMIERVYACAQKSAARRVIVATDDGRIEKAVKDFGGEVCMTSSEHQSGTDRLQEVAEKMAFAEADIVVNVQGDEPLIPASVINQVADNLAANAAASCATLCEKIASYEDCFNPNIVKVVTNEQGFALYFSRAPIPWDRDNFVLQGAGEQRGQLHLLAKRHIGIYAYRVALLHQFVQWPPAPLEQLEKLEQLRILANAHNIHVEEACEIVPGGIDTADDLQRLNALLDSESGKIESGKKE